MLKINKQTITLTKGDDASLRLVPRYKDKTEYVLTEGDSAVFRIKFGHTLVELQCTLNLETNKIVANITPNDTKDFNPGIYRYEAELITSFGFHYTFIADQTFILGQEYEQRITSTSNGNSSAVGGNLPEIDGIVDGEPVVYGDIQPTNPMMDYEELNHLPKLNGKTIKGDKNNEYYGIPTKTSDLENDSDFISDDDYVHTDNNYDDTAKNAVDALGTASTYDVPESGNASTSQVVKGDDSRLRDNRDPNPHTHQKADITDFPTNVSAFNNDSGFITNTVNNLANYYLKADTYTKTEVEQLIAAIKQGKFEIVAELPASGDANVIYLVPKSTAQTSNSYDEYVYINNAWELIGDTEIDLSGYVTDDELTTALQSYLTTSAFNTAIASYYTKTETDNLLGNKVDKVAGKGLSTNDYDNTAKGIVDGVTSALNDKVDKVQGKGLSTNDYDNTAKGIVDGVTSALADKVDKVNGKGLSTEDYTTAEKSKLGGISENAKKVASSSTNGHIEIDDVDTTVYDDTAVQTAIENIEDELSTDSATVEGNPLNFSTLSAQNAESTIIDLEPIQDLHGYDKPWIGGAGKNKLQMTIDAIKSANTDGTWSGLKYTLNSAEYTLLTDSDNNIVGINVNRTTSDANNATLKIPFNCSNNTTYIFNGTPTNDHTNYAMSVAGVGYASVEGMQFTTTLTQYTINITVYASKLANNVKFYPMIRLSTETDSTFAPYTNICPISGRTQIGVLGTGKNIVDDSKFVRKHAQTGVENDKWLSFDQYIPYKPNAEYVFTSTIGIQSVFLLGIYLYDDELNYVDSMSKTYVNPNNVSFTIPNTNAHYFRFGFYDANSLADYSFENPLLRLASDADSNFEPYTKSTDLTISLGQTVYGGSLDVENGVLSVINVSKTFDGSSDEVISLSSEEQGLNKWRIIAKISDNSITFTDQKTITGKIWSDKFVEVPNADNSVTPNRGTYYGEVGMHYRVDGSHNVIIAPQVSSIVDEASARTWLSNNPVQICYTLAAPITINLTPNTINLLKGVNNISTDGDKITLTYRDGSVATLEDVKLATENLETQIADAQILTDTVTGDKYILVVTNGVLSVEQISN